MFDNLALLLSISIPLITALSAVVGLGIKVFAVVKQRNTERAQIALEEAAREAVAFVEALKSKTGDNLLGETKKNIALVRINQALIERGFRFNIETASDVIEKLVQLTKEVNVKK